MEKFKNKTHQNMVLHEADCHTRPCTSARCHPNRTQKMSPHYPVREKKER